MKKNPFSSTDIHKVLISDITRTSAYKRAIQRCVKPGFTVLDIGCGSGIFSFFAKQAAAGRVVGIDNTGIIHSAAETARKNHLDIEFIKKDILKYSPTRKFDVVIHEITGDHLWNENIVPIINHVRKKILKPGGLIIPHRIDIYLVPVSYKTETEKSRDFLKKKHYGIDFRPLYKSFLIENIKTLTRSSIVFLKNRNTFLSTPKPVYTLNVNKDISIPEKITSNFRIKKSSGITGAVLFFKTHLYDKVTFSTGPQKNNTHWGQIFLPCFENIFIKEGGELSIDIIPGNAPAGWKFAFYKSH